MSVTFCFLKILKSHCWNFIKPCKHVYIYKTNTLNTWFIEISDPVAYASGRLKLVSQQRQERSTLENEVDIEHTNELTKLSAPVLLNLFNELRKRDKM